MGANLKPIAENFSIHKEAFATDSHDVRDEVVAPGTHDVLRFDFLMHNISNQDMVVGAPEEQPDLFVWSAGHDHYHLKDFNLYVLLDESGQPVTAGYKQSFCLRDDVKLSLEADPNPYFTDCNENQGVSAGWADRYDSSLPGQYLVIDDVPNGDYTLLAIVNAQHVAAEDSYADNTVAVGLHLHDDTVEVINPPSPDVAVDAFHDLWTLTPGTWDLTPGTNVAPQVVAENQDVDINVWNDDIEDWFAGFDVDDDTITHWALYDEGTSDDSGWFFVDGRGFQNPGEAFVVSTDELHHSTWFGDAREAGSETLYAAAWDGTTWGEWEPFTVTSHDLIV